MVRSLAILSAFWFALASATADAAPPPKGPIQFETHIRPILKAHCFHCHGDEDEKEGKLDLRLVRLMSKGGESGPAVVLGQHRESLLYQKIASGEMPPTDKKMPAGELALVARWIDEGAKTARPEPDEIADITDDERSFWSFQPITRPTVPQVRNSAQVRTPVDAFILAKLEGQGLRFSPQADPATLCRRVYFDLTGLPPTPDEVSRFVQDIKPRPLVADAANKKDRDQRSRLYEIAYEALIDRLLASPRYGERWGRHWLDVAGYADSDGNSEKDFERQHAWHYRDYVIRSFNEDKPLDQFIVEQLAGDELIAPPHKNLSPAQVEILAATGFLRMAPDGTAAGNTEVARNEMIAESLKITSSALLGLTVGCAQCHNHRYDPIAQADYYRFRAIFEPAYDLKQWRLPNARLVSLQSAVEKQKVVEIDAKIKDVNAKRTAELNAYMKEVFDNEVAKLPKELHGAVRSAYETLEAKRTPEQKKLLSSHPKCNVTLGNLYLYDRKRHEDMIKPYDAQVKALQDQRPVEQFLHATTELAGRLPETRLYNRGDIGQPRQVVEPAELAVLNSDGFAISLDDNMLPTSGRRLSYARRLTDGKHPLVTRVLANRVWMHHFGRGIVGTPTDFGQLGERPTHPELLDWLATELVRGGWRLKSLHKTLLMSAAYRQSSHRTADLDAVDPENRLLGRMSVRRLEAEAIRDAMLSVSGQLVNKLYGPAVPVMPDDVGQVVVGVDTRDTAGRPTGKVVPLGEEEFRRSMYVQVRRSLPMSMLETFDAPVMTPNCDCRSSSTVAPQSLLFMNNTFVLKQAEVLAERVRRESPSEDIRTAVGRAWQLVFAADPTREQLDEATAFVQSQVKALSQSATLQLTSKTAGAGKVAKPADPVLLALANYCQALLSSNRFLYVD